MILGTALVSLFLMMVPPTVSAQQQALQTAQSHFAAGRFAEAVTMLTAALDLSPRDAAVNYWLARSYYEQHNYEKSITYAEAAVKLAPENGEYQRWLGRIYGAKAEQSHSFFLARKVKQSFETAVRLAPRSIEARRDLMQYLVEAPWIVGGDKSKAREQIQAIAQLDPMEGRLAQAAYFCEQKKWKEAETEYLAVLELHPSRIEPYMEAAEFFSDRKDPSTLDRVVADASRVNSHDPRLDFYRAVVLILRGTERPTAEKLLTAYINIPERSDYPSHNKARQWLQTGKQN
jgi:tetratricopeptide (TPR) repeat protein